MITEDLMQKAEIAIAEARRELEQHRFQPYFLARRDGEYKLLPFDGAMLDRKETKRAVFRAIRMLARRIKLDAVIFVTDMWMAQVTEAGLKFVHDHPEEWGRLARESRFVTAVKRGLVTRTEALHVSVQTPDEVRWINQPYDRDPGGGIVFGKRWSVSSLDPDAFIDGDSLVFGGEADPLEGVLDEFFGRPDARKSN